VQLKICLILNSKLIIRALEKEVLRLNGLFPVIVITGPRQSGKTTLCKSSFPDYAYFNLELPNLREQIELAPQQFLIQNRKGVILDEVQRFPELLSYIQVIADDYPDSKFILTGSSNFSLLQGVTQSLAGRAAILNLLPLALNEIGETSNKIDTNSLLLRGGYPAVWAKEIPVQDLSRNYYNTYIERDVRQLLNIKDISKFQIFIRLCASRTASEFNASALSNETGVSVPSIQEWLSVLESSYIIFKLPPFFKNIGKRLVKSPKIYFCDTGLLCFLLGIENEKQLAVHPLRGAIFENYVVLEFLKHQLNQGKLSNLYFYRDKSYREVDLLVEKAGFFRAFEIKSAKSIHGDFFNNLNYLKTIIGDSLISTQIIYDGELHIDDLEKGMLNFRKLNFETGS
jgi:predicted AAA+ superfamily ATPase